MIDTRRTPTVEKFRNLRGAECVIGSNIQCGDLSVPYKATTNGRITSSPPLSISLSHPVQANLRAGAIMASLSVPDCVPSPAEDAEQLHKAFEGWGTNEKLIISILAHRNAAQRKLICQVYKEIHGKSLLKDLNSELSSDFERLVILWALDPAERDAALANRAIRNRHPTGINLIEISCSRSSDQLLLVRKAYQVLYKMSLEEDVAAHTKESFRKLLVPLVCAYRYEGPEVNMSLAKSEAKLLHEKISDKKYDDDEVIRILATRSKLQIGATLNHYNDEFGHPISEDLNVDDHNKFLAALSAVLSCLTCPEKYFEDVLRTAINRRGTDEDALTRVVATRTEVDMEHIKEEYFRRNSVHLARAIAKDTHGDYEDMLLALVGKENA